jgi:hypothetical protein
MGEMRDSFRFSVGKPGRERLFARPRCKWENDIKLNLKEVGCEGVD